MVQERYFEQTYELLNVQNCASISQEFNIVFNGFNEDSAYSSMNMVVVQLVILGAAALVTSICGFPLPTIPNRSVPPSKVLDFMKQYGYIEQSDNSSEALYTEQGISETIKLVQRFGAINESGVLDEETLKLMVSPRCGVPDVLTNKRNKRYVLGSQGWNKRTITYFIANWSPSLGEKVVAKNIQLALDTWGRYGRLVFQQVFSPDADIIVGFGRGPHGDRYPFDGPGTILAHAFFPYEQSDLGGDIHFDDDENWTDRKEEGTDFFTVALHELGHSLGLAHSITPSSIMFPYYRGYDPDNSFQLGYDDILGMYELYIRRHLDGDDKTMAPRDEDIDETTTESELVPSTDLTTETSFRTTEKPRSTITEKIWESTTSTGMSTITYENDNESVEDHKKHDTTHHIPATNSPSLPNICNGHFDAVATLREELFIFKEQYVWRLKEKLRIEEGYPVALREMFPDLPKEIQHVDAAYERPDGMIILFTGKQFWVYNGERFIENSPRLLQDYGLPATLDKIDAVQTWGRNGKTYFYKQDRFWRYNETAQEMDSGYPKHMEKWRGVPENLDAATTWKDGITYFFKENLFWKFDNDWVIITDESPLPASQIWLGCPEDPQNMVTFYNS